MSIFSDPKNMKLHPQKNIELFGPTVRRLLGFVLAVAYSETLAAKFGFSASKFWTSATNFWLTKAKV